jgi:hypothetical protein
MDQISHNALCRKRPPSAGHTLVEVLLVLGLLAACSTAGVACLLSALGAQEARGAAQNWQAAAAWGQVGIMWQGGSATVDYDEGTLTVRHDLALCGGSLGASAPLSAVDANVVRWRTAGGVAVRFGGRLASPDGGGSLYFDSGSNRYRVVVRPESGLTVRSHSVLER